MDFVSVFDRYGLPIALVAIMVFAAWRFMTWIKPWFEQLFTAHLQLIRSIESTQKETTKALQDMARNSVCNYPKRVTQLRRPPDENSHT